jgi:hypothetical protein
MYLIYLYKDSCETWNSLQNRSFGVIICLLDDGRGKYKREEFPL